MEENIRRDARRARDARAAFSATESSASAEESDARPARRRAAPAVTFQPPQPGSSAEGHSPEEAPRTPRVRKTTSKPPVAKVPPQPAEPSAESEATAAPAKAAPAKKAAPRPARKAAAAKAAPAAKAPAPKQAPKHASTESSTPSGGGAPASAKAAASEEAATEATAPATKEAAPKATATGSANEEAATRAIAPATKTAATKATAPATKTAATGATGPASKEAATKATTPASKAKKATPGRKAKPEPTRKAVTTAAPVTPAEKPTVLDLWPALLADPAQAPEILAHAAVETIGPRAQAWADGIRAAYPRATPDGLARLAALRFTRSAGLRAGLGAIAGPYAPVALLTAAAITQAELVLHLAAAYGKDATDPQRTADLLRLVPFEKRWLAAWAAVRIADRALPGVGLAAAVLASRNAVGDVATRARRFYRESQSSQESGSS